MDEENTNNGPENESPVSRGTASKPSPFSGESAPKDPDPEEEATITIHAPDASVREYILTDDVKEMYETKYETRFKNMPVSWFDMWWVGTTLVIEYEGFIRDTSLRPSGEDADMDAFMSMMFSARSQKADGIPRAYHPAYDGPRTSMRDIMKNGGQPSGKNLSVDLREFEDGLERLDEGIVPVANRVEIDIQERADEYPLQVEDLFVKPWSDDEGQMPVNSEHADGEVDEEIFDVNDFRDFTDSEDETLPDGAYGTRFNV